MFGMIVEPLNFLGIHQPLLAGIVMRAAPSLKQHKNEALVPEGVLDRTAREEGFRLSPHTSSGGSMLLHRTPQLDHVLGESTPT